MSAASLAIGEGLRLPEEAVTETFAILGKRGKGKTETGVVLAEEMTRAGLPVVIADPVGVWWGIRSSADGRADGLPVVIFGGDHADVPLERGAGALIADVVVNQRISAVLDLSHLPKAGVRTVMADFLERLYHRNREALHVILDEADAFAPQRAMHGGERLLGAVEDLVRRGRARGIGVTLITQRPAVLHKDVLTQAEVLVALGMTGPRDVAAIDEWVRLHADEDQAREVKASLPSLPVGTSWWWSPGWLGILVRVKVRRRTTFDSSATPKPGQVRRAPRRMAEVDLAALGEQIAATVERARADDPKLLRARIADLERELAAERAKPAPEPVVERVEVPVLDFGVIDQVEAALGPACGLLAEIQETLVKHRTWLEQQMWGETHEEAVARTTQPAPAPRAERQTPPAREQPAAGGLTRAQRALLTALVQRSPLTHVQLALLSGYSHRSSSFSNALGTLRSASYATGGRDAISATDDGRTVLGPVEPLPAGPALVEHWMAQLGKAERALLGVLLARWPHSLTADELAERSGYSRTSSSFSNALGRLRSLELASGGRDAITANDELGAAFGGGR